MSGPRVSRRLSPAFLAAIVVGSLIGVATGLVIRDLTSSSDLGEALLGAGVVVLAGVIVLVAVIVAAVRRSGRGLAIIALLVVGAFIGATLGPDNANRDRPSVGTVTLTTIPDSGVHWVGPATCWKRADRPAVDSIETVVSSIRPPVHVILGLPDPADLLVPASPGDLIGGIWAGLAEGPDSNVLASAQLSSLDALPDHRRGHAVSELWTDIMGVLPDDPFLERQIAFSWSCAAAPSR